MARFGLRQKNHTFTETKTGELKALPIGDGLCAELLKWREQSKSEYLFPSTRRSKLAHIYEKPHKLVKSIATALGLQDICYHSTRHAAASWATQGGVSRQLVGKLLGHRDLKTTDRYSHLDVDHLRPAVNLIERLVLDSAPPHSSMGMDPQQKI